MAHGTASKGCEVGGLKLERVKRKTMKNGIIEFEHLGDLSPVLKLEEIEGLDVMNRTDKAKSKTLLVYMKSGIMHMVNFDTPEACIKQKKSLTEIIKTSLS
jgi:hypothetical protein